MKSALSDLYQEELLAYASAVEQFSRLQKPTGTGTAVSRSCGSRVTVDLMLLEDVISDIGLDVDACALGSASSAIVAEKAVGKTLDEISSLGPVNMVHVKRRRCYTDWRLGNLQISCAGKSFGKPAPIDLFDL